MRSTYHVRIANFQNVKALFGGSGFRILSAATHKLPKVCKLFRTEVTLFSGVSSHARAIHVCTVNEDILKSFRPHLQALISGSQKVG